MFTGALLTIILITSGCSGIHMRGDSISGGPHANIAGPTDILNIKVERLDIVSLLDPGKSKDYRDGFSKNCFSDLSDKCIAWYSKQLTSAMDKFNQKHLFSGKKIAARNAIQDQILLSSEQRCNFYKKHLRSVSTRSDFLFGSLTTISAGAGAIVTGEASVRMFSGLAGIFSGLRSEFNQVYFNNLAMEVVISGIDIARKDILRGLIAYRMEHDADEYTVQAAIQDALQFHGACSIISGIQAAGQAVEEIDNPGIVMIEKVMRHQKLIDEIKKVEETSKLPLKAGYEFYTRKSGVVPKPLGLLRTAQYSLGAKSITSAAYRYAVKLEKELMDVFLAQLKRQEVEIKDATQAVSFVERQIKKLASDSQKIFLAFIDTIMDKQKEVTKAELEFEKSPTKPASKLKLEQLKRDLGIMEVAVEAKRETLEAMVAEIKNEIEQLDKTILSKKDQNTFNNDNAINAIRTAFQKAKVTDL